jgi:hypothetical protein
MINQSYQKQKERGRELQRVLKKLCDDGQLERLGRGHYRLTEQNGNPADPADPTDGQKQDMQL